MTAYKAYKKKKKKKLKTISLDFRITFIYLLLLFKRLLHRLKVWLLIIFMVLNFITFNISILFVFFFFYLPMCLICHQIGYILLICHTTCSLDFFFLILEANIFATKEICSLGEFTREIMLVPFPIDVYGLLMSSFIFKIFTLRSMFASSSTLLKTILKRHRPVL